MKESLVHNIVVSRQLTTRLIAEIPGALHFKSFSTDLNQGYLKSTETIQGYVYLEPPKELKLRKDQAVKHINPFRDYVKVVNTREKPFKIMLNKSVKWNKVYFNVACFYNIAIIHSVEFWLHMLMELSMKRMTYTQGFAKRLKKHPNTKKKYGKISVLQDERLKWKEISTSSIKLSIYRELKRVSRDGDYSHCRSLRENLAWCVPLRPDICSAVALSL